MSQFRPFREYIKTLPPEQQREIEEGAKKMIAQCEARLRRREVVRSVLRLPTRMAVWLRSFRHA